MKKRKKEKRNEATERAIFIDFQGPFRPWTRQNIVRIVRLVSGLGISWQINSTRHPSPLAPSTKFIPKGNRMGALQHFNLVTTREFDGGRVAFGLGKWSTIAPETGWGIPSHSTFCIVFIGKRFTESGVGERVHHPGIPRKSVSIVVCRSTPSGDLIRAQMDLFV